MSPNDRHSPPLLLQSIANPLIVGGGIGVQFGYPWYAATHEAHFADESKPVVHEQVPPAQVPWPLHEMP